MPKRKLTGEVVSNKMLKTLVVKVESVKVHPKYKRRYKFHKKYKAHVKEGEYNIGDWVMIEECTPISKEKKWQVVKKIASAAKEEVAEEIIEDDKEEIPQEIKP